MKDSEFIRFCSENGATVQYGDVIEDTYIGPAMEVTVAVISVRGVAKASGLLKMADLDVPENLDAFRDEMAEIANALRSEIEAIGPRPPGPDEVIAEALREWAQKGCGRPGCTSCGGDGSKLREQASVPRPDPRLN